MSDCTRRLEALLEAEPEELSGRGDTELALHLRECDRCGAIARTILEANAELHDALGAARTPVDVDAVLARARASEAPQGAPRAVTRRAGWVATAVAAALTGLLLTRGRDVSLPGTPYVPSPEAPSLVEAPADRNVVVLPTRNPNITVLWFY